MFIGLTEILILVWPAGLVFLSYLFKRRDLRKDSSLWPYARAKKMLKIKTLFMMSKWYKLILLNVYDLDPVFIIFIELVKQDMISYWESISFWDQGPFLTKFTKYRVDQSFRKIRGLIRGRCNRMCGNIGGRSEKQKKYHFLGNKKKTFANVFQYFTFS